MKRKLYYALLSAFVITGILRPALKLAGENSQLINTLNISPGSVVFSDFRFFSEIRISFIYPDKIVPIPSHLIIDTPDSDLYKGKLKYSLLYMDYIFPTKKMAWKVNEFYLCDMRPEPLQELKIARPKFVRIDYANRETKEILLTRKYSCTEEFF